MDQLSLDRWGGLYSPLSSREARPAQAVTIAQWRAQSAAPKGLFFIARASRLYRPPPRARPRRHGELLKLLRALALSRLPGPIGPGMFKSSNPSHPSAAALARIARIPALPGRCLTTVIRLCIIARRCESGCWARSRSLVHGDRPPPPGPASSSSSSSSSSCSAAAAALADVLDGSPPSDSGPGRAPGLGTAQAPKPKRTRGPD